MSWKNVECIRQTLFINKKTINCPTRGMGEKSSSSGEDFSLFVDAAARVQGKAWMVFSLDPSNPWILGPQEFGFSRRVLTLDRLRPVIYCQGR